jgi:hypothetical protein
MAYTNTSTMILAGVSGDGQYLAEIVGPVRTLDVNGTIIDGPEETAESQVLPLGTSSFSFGVGPGPLDRHRAVGLRLGRLNFPGPLFRSGYLDSLPATPIEIFEPAWYLITDEDLAANITSSLGTPPFPVPGHPSITVTALSTAIEEGQITVVAEGTHPGGPLGTVSWRFRGGLVIDPVREMVRVGDGTTPQPIAAARSVGEPQLELFGGSPSIPETELILQLLRPALAPYVAGFLATAVTQRLTSTMVAEVGKVVGRLPGAVTTVPPSIVISLERLVIGTFRPTPEAQPRKGLNVLASLGTFGSVIGTLFPDPTNRPGCLSFALIPFLRLRNLATRV